MITVTLTFADRYRHCWSSTSNIQRQQIYYYFGGLFFQMARSRTIVWQECKISCFISVQNVLQVAICSLAKLLGFWLNLGIICIYRFGCAKVVISDQGREFVNQVNQYLFSITQTKHRVTSAYHPQTNGMVEQFNQTLQRSLVKIVNNNQNNWDEKLDGILFAYRTSQHQSSVLLLS